MCSVCVCVSTCVHVCVLGVCVRACTCKCASVQVCMCRRVYPCVRLHIFAEDEDEEDEEKARQEMGDFIAVSFEFFFTFWAFVEKGFKRFVFFSL